MAGFEVQVGETKPERQTLLIVEPEPLLRWSMVTYLSRWFEVFEAESAASALRIQSRQTVDALVVSDQIPDALFENLERAALAGKTGVVVVRTVATRNPESTRCIEKPFALVKLAQLLGAVPNG